MEIFMFQKLNARFKIALFGDGGVGKTTLINRYLTGRFINDFNMTIGVEFYTKTFSIANKRVSLKIWDFAGHNQFQFKNLLPNYMSGASGGIFMYDITRFASIKNVDAWLQILMQGLSGYDHKIPILLVGGKCDLKKQRSVEMDYAMEIAKEKYFYDFIECSSVTGENIKNIFDSIAIKMLKMSNLR